MGRIKDRSTPISYHQFRDQVKVYEPRTMHLDSFMWVFERDGHLFAMVYRQPIWSHKEDDKCYKL